MTTDRLSSRGPGRVPPHSVEAEESVLGAVLLSLDAANEVMDKLEPEDFYVPAHQAIFGAVRDLYNANTAIDAVTVTEELRRVGMLEKVGGVGYVTRLLDVVPSTSNVGYYAGIVEEHALRRSLIRVGSVITDFAMELDEEIAAVLDRSEQTVLGVAGRRVGEGMQPVGPMFQSVLEYLEELEARGSEVTGLSTGFRDLDRKLAGLQPANLVVIAARPSMGKSALTTNIATNVAAMGGPVAIFSLEMAKEEIVQRILCSVGRVDSMKLRSGQLGPLWARVVEAASKMYRAPIFIDDSANLTVTDIRAKCRRLKRQHGLALVVIDYLQLMQGSSRENRQQEIAEISRSLKNLARELEVPIIAVSQLNRSVEMREDKRPRLSDLRESGCLVADTLVTRADTNERVRIGDLAAGGETDVPVWTLDERLRLVPGTISCAFPSGEKKVFELRFASGRTVTASANHPFLTVEGWRPVERLEVGDHLATARRVPPPSGADYESPERIVLLAHLIGDGCHPARHALQYTTTDAANAAVVAATARAEFEVEPRIVPERKWTQVYLTSARHLTRGVRNPISEWLDHLGLFDRRSWEKFVPEFVLALPPADIALFLRHLWATDGSATVAANGSVRVYYATSSERLARDVTDLLARIDLRARLRRVAQRRGIPQFRVDISGRDDQLRFLDVVGLFGTRSSPEAAIRAVLGARATSNPNVDVIPAAIWDFVRHKSLPESGITTRELAHRLGMSYSGSTLYRSGLSRDRMARLAEAIGDEALHDLATSDVLWDRLVAIEHRGVQPVFDATVPGTHNFLANGVVAHNSIEQDSDVVMFIYRDEYYNEQSDKKGIAEVVVAKHRAGATGSVEMTFMAEFTRFSDLGRDVT
jgi:replicative DNA helicase